MKAKTSTALKLLSRVVRELSPFARSLLGGSDKVCVFVSTSDIASTWASFPIRKAQRAKLELLPKTRILFTLSEKEATKSPDVFVSNVAHHLGHILCYLSNGRWIHHCQDADRLFERFLWPGTKRLRNQVARGLKQQGLGAKQASREMKAWPVKTRPAIQCMLGRLG